MDLGSIFFKVTLSWSVDYVVFYYYLNFKFFNSLFNVVCKFSFWYRYDMYGRRITFTFQGEEEYKTFIGAVVSWIVFIIMVLYTYLMISVLVLKKDTQKSTISLVKDLRLDSDSIDLSETDFEFAFALTDDNYDVEPLDDTYIYFELNQYTITTDSDGISTTNTQTLTHVAWASTYFPFEDAGERNAYSIYEYECATDNTFEILGNSYASSYKYFELILRKCDGTSPSGTTCQTDSDIDSYISALNLDMAVVNSYFDFDNYPTPVQTFVDDRLNYTLHPNIKKTATVYIQKNTIELKDSFFRYSPQGKSSSFVNIEKTELDFDELDSDKIIMKVRFEKDYDYKSYERQVYSILNLFGDLGGVFGIFSLAGSIFVGIFADRLFNYSLISTLYQVDPLSPDESKIVDQPIKIKPQSYEDYKIEMYKNNTVPGVGHGPSYTPNIKANYHSRQKQSESYLKSQSTGTLKYSSHEARNDLMMKARCSMANRRNYNYSFMDFNYNLLCCWKCSFLNKKGTYGLYNRFVLHEKGLDKYIKEFDAEYYARSLRNLKMLVSSLMDDSERFMSNYQHCNSISLLKSDTEDDSEHEPVKHMPGYLWKSPDECSQHYNVIDTFLENYFKETHSSKDYKLLKGAFTSKKLKNEELKNLNPDKEDSYDNAMASSVEDNDDSNIAFAVDGISIHNPNELGSKVAPKEQENSFIEGMIEDENQF